MQKFTRIRINSSPSSFSTGIIRLGSFFQHGFADRAEMVQVSLFSAFFVRPCCLDLLQAFQSPAGSRTMKAETVRY